MTSIEVIKDALPSFLTIRPETYVNKTTKAVFIDAKYGEFQATPKSILRGKLHRERALELRKNIKKTPSEVQNQLPLHIELKIETYVNNSVRCIFIDKEFGEFVSTPNLVISKGVQHPVRSTMQRRITCMEKYGVDHPSKSPELFSKMRSHMRRTKTVVHWQTQEELLATGSYETKTLEWLNRNKIPFQWQIPFKLMNGAVYYCDLFLPTTNMFVEIKGWWQQPVSKAKWQEFHEMKPNSELWTKEVLEQKGILNPAQVVRNLVIE